MKKIAYLFLLLIVLGSCSHRSGSGNIITETRSAGSFDGISVGGDFEVEVKTGDAISVVVEADDNIMKYIETTVSGNTLKIRTEDMNNYSNVHMKVYITAPAIKSIRASASAQVDVEGVLINTNQLTFDASSGASIKSKVDAPGVSAEASSGASIDLDGKTRDYTAGASSGAEIRTEDLLSETTTVKVSSGASAAVHASVNLNASASSGGSVRYRGAATVTKSESSGGSVSKSD